VTPLKETETTKTTGMTVEKSQKSKPIKEIRQLNVLKSPMVQETQTRTNTRQQQKDVNDNQDEENSSVMPEKLGEIDVTDHYGSTDLAQMVMAREYHKENPQVPYAMWRSGTATGRSRTTVEIAPQVDDLVKNVMREFEARYDAEINKADLREFAMVLGLMQTDDLFEMAEEWGLQHNG
jgi:hypothetical protein